MAQDGILTPDEGQGTGPVEMSPPERSESVYALTYDHPHRKTQDAVFRLLAAGVKPVLIVQPWEERKHHRPLYQLRPQNHDITPKQLVRSLGLERCDIESIPPNSRVLIAGAGILSREFVFRHRVVNAHPGRIPTTRGLDALKWAIYYGDQIGVTLHRVDSQCDMGGIIEFREIVLYSTDTIHSIAQRLYDLEIDMLVSAATRPLDCKEISEPAMSPNRRMPKEQEIQLAHRLQRRLLECNDIGRSNSTTQAVW